VADLRTKLEHPDDAIRVVRSALRCAEARTVAAVCGVEHLDERDKAELIQDLSAAPLANGEALMLSAYRLGRDGGRDIADVESGALTRACAAAEGTIRAQYAVIMRAALEAIQSVPDGGLVEEATLQLLLRGARNTLRRVISAEIVGAVNLGRAHSIGRSHGAGASVIKRLSPSACATCRAVHTAPDGTPRAFRLSALKPSRATSLATRAPIEATIGPAHPGCLCVLELSGSEPSRGINPTSIAREIELYKAGEVGGAHIDFQGLPIVIENAPGTIRSWRGATGRKGSTLMLFGYGYIEGTKGGENEELDVFVGPDPSSPYVFIVHQHRVDAGSDRNWDEDKVLLGFTSIHDAIGAYLAHYDDPRFLGSISSTTIDEFKRRLPQGGGFYGGMDVSPEIPPLIEEPKERLMLRRSMEGDIPFDGQPINGQWNNRGVQTGSAGPSLAVVSPAHISSADAAQGAGYKKLAEDAAKEKARWVIRIDPTVLFVRQDLSESRPVHPIANSDIAILAADLDPKFAEDIHEFIADQARRRTEAQALGAPNVDRDKPPEESPEEPAAEAERV